LSKAEFEEQSIELGLQLMNIRISDKIQVMFNVRDPIFSVSEQLD
jgi:hypothetical protein